jgi:hypothetical protein
MSRRILTDALGVDAEGDLTITDLQFVSWGRDLVFVLAYRAGIGAPELSFRMLFTDCRELRWKTYAHGPQGVMTNPTELVEFGVGESDHRKDAALLTEHFSAQISYGALTLELRDRKIRL